MKKVLLAVTSLLFLASSLTACGGGGSGGSASPTPNPPANQAPTASNSTLLLDEGTTETSQLVASDPNSDALTYAVVTTPINGTLQVNTQTGSFEYSANVGSPGNDSFTFLVNDGQADSGEATVSIAINRTPVVSSESLTVVEGEALSYTLGGSDPDGDSLTFSIVKAPTTGTFNFDPQSGDIEFVADLDSEGTESLIFVANDGRLDSANGTISITIEPRLPVEVAKLIHPNPEKGGFGMSVDISGNSAIVGSGTSEFEGYFGAARLYTRDESGVWNYEAQLIPTNVTPEEYSFGWTVRINGTTAFVGATTVDINESQDSGYVYIFEKNPEGEWLQQAKLAPSNYFFGDGFASGEGDPLSVSGSTLAVGAWGRNSAEHLGSVYVFDQDEAGDWTETARIVSPDPLTWDDFGIVVEIDGDNMAVRGMRVNGSGVPSDCRVFIFSRDQSGSWSPSEELVDPSPNPDSCFGASLAMDSNRLLVGTTRGEFCAGEPSSTCSASHIFEQDESGNWSYKTSLPSDGQPVDSRTFGITTALEGNKAIVGYSGSQSTPYSIHIFQEDSGGDWVQLVELSASDGQPFDRFGDDLAISSNLAIVGAPLHDGSITNAGAAYIIDLR